MQMTEDQMQGFWRTWLTVWCWGVLAFGVVLALAAVPAADGLARFVFVTFSSDPSNAALFDLPAMRFALGLQGALTIGWALTVFGMLRAADVGGVPVWRSLTVSLIVWYFIDSTISVSTGFALNAVSNTVFIATYLVPVLSAGVLRVHRRAAV
jgi:hypothetical protein